MIEKILKQYQKELNGHYSSYLNHSLRVYEYALILMLQKENKNLFIAAAFHDLDIWIAKTMDYLQGSSALAAEHIRKYHPDVSIEQIQLIINNHHKIFPIRENREAEAFRKADLIDLSAGLIHFNIPKSIIKDAERRFPRLKFSKIISRKVILWSFKNPLNPLPMLRWK